MANGNDLAGVENSILEFIKGRFYITDNFPRLVSEENELIMEKMASFLMRFSLGTDRFSGLLGKSPLLKTCDGKIRLQLSRPIEISLNNQFGTCNFCFNEALLDIDKAYWELYTLGYPDDGCSMWITNHTREFENNRHARDDIMAGARADLQKSTNELARKAFRRISLFECCKEVIIRDTPKGVCEYYFERPRVTPYSAPTGTHSHVRYDEFVCHDECAPLGKIPGVSECDHLADILEQYVGESDYGANLTETFEKDYSGWQQVYSFRDANDIVTQKVIKLFEPTRCGKRLIPCTSWRQRDQTFRMCVFVPRPKTQLLYNLNLLENNKPSAIILTDSIEIAEQNQKNHKNGKCVWTSFLPDNEYEAIDWSPLKKDAAQVYCLVTNHSGRNLAEAYMKAGNLASYLRDKEGLTKLKFIQVAVQYHTTKTRYEKLSEIIAGRIAMPPKVICDSVKVMDEGEFDKYRVLAEKELTIRKHEFWEDQEARPEITTVPTKKENARLDPIEYLMRPMIYSNEINMLYAFRGVGKTVFALSLCASIISGTDILPGRIWLAPPQSKYPIKILYFYLERAKTLPNRKAIFAASYLASTKQNVNQDDLIIMTHEDIEKLKIDMDLTDVANQQPVLDYIQCVGNSYGTKGHPVDLVVFDTYSKILGGGPERDEDWKNLMPFFKRLKSQGAAILLIHHSTKAGKEGQGRGFKAKEDDLISITKMWHDNDVEPPEPSDDDLSDDMLSAAKEIYVRIEKASENVIPFDENQFQVRFDKKTRQWQLVGDSDILMSRNFLRIANEYKASGFRVDAIAMMMGNSRANHYKAIEKHEEVLEKAKKAKKKDPASDDANKGK